MALSMSFAIEDKMSPKIAKQTTALAKATDAARDTSRVLEEMNDKMDSLGESSAESSAKTQELQANIEYLTEKYERQKDVVSEHRTALDDLNSAQDENDKKLVESLGNLESMTEAELTATKAALERSIANETNIEKQDQMRESLERVENQLGEVTEAEEETGSVFEKVAEIFKNKAVLMGTAIAGVVTAAFKMAESTASVAKEASNTSQKLGLTTTGFQEWEYVLRKSGTSIDVLGVGMKTLQKTMGGLTEDGDSASAAFHAIGIEFDDIKGKSPEEALNMTVSALQDMPEGADRTTAALKLLGKGAMELQPLLNKTSETTEELKDRSHELGLVMSDEQLAAAGEFRGAVGRLNDELTATKNAIGNALIPVFNAMLGVVISAIDGYRNLSPAVKTVVTILGTYVAVGTAATLITKLASIEVKGYSLAKLGAAAADNAHAVITGISTAATSAYAMATSGATVAQIAAAAATWLWNTALFANPVIAIVAGVAALVAGLVVLVGWLSEATDEEKALTEASSELLEKTNELSSSAQESASSYEESIYSLEQNAAAAEDLANKISALSEIEYKSAVQKEELASYVNSLNEAMGETIVEYNAEADILNRSTDYIKDKVAALKEEAAAQVSRERIVELYKEEMAVKDELAGIESQRAEVEKLSTDRSISGRRAYNKAITDLNAAEAEAIKTQGELSGSMDRATKAAEEAEEAMIAYNKAIYENADEATRALIDANETQEKLSQDKIKAEQEVTDEMIKAASAQGMLLEEYQTKLDETQKTIEDYTTAATDMFKVISEKQDESIADMTSNMEQNQEVINNWSNNLIEAGERGLSQGLLEKLRDAGPESAATVAAIVAGSDEEIARLSEVFENGSEVATEALMKQLGLPDVVNSGKNMVDDIAKGVDNNTALKSSTEKLVKDAKSTATSTVAASGFSSIGISMLDGIISGLNSRTGWLYSTIRTIIGGALNEAKKASKTASPSRSWRDELGVFWAQGAGIGFADEMEKVIGNMKTTISAIPKKLRGSKAESGDVVGASLSKKDKKALGTAVTNNSSSKNVSINPNVSVTIQKVDSESDVDWIVRQITDGIIKKFESALA